jgi:hypothetical protein
MNHARRVKSRSLSRRHPSRLGTQNHLELSTGHENENITRLLMRDETARGFPGVSGVTGKRMFGDQGSALHTPDQPDNGNEDDRAYDRGDDRSDQSTNGDPQ